MENGNAGNADPAKLATSGPPFRVDLFRYALVSADLAEGDRSVADVLASHSLTLEQWTAVSTFWSLRMAEDAGRHPEARVTVTFSEAFARAQDAKKPLRELSVEEWAALTEQIATDGSPVRALAVRQLSTADYMRLVRTWARALGTDPVLARAFEAARALAAARTT